MDSGEGEGRVVGRRRLLKGIGGAAAAAVVGRAATAQQQQGTPPEPGVTTDDVAALDRLTARAHTESERRMMARSLSSTRRALIAVRGFGPAGETEPAVHFDPLLPGRPAPPAGRGVCRIGEGEPRAYDGRPESLAFATVVELSRLLRARRVTSLELTRMYLDRLKKFGPRLNCVVTLTEERALEQAARADREITAGDWRGPLHGVPYGAKDLFATRGIRTTFGAKPYENQVIPFDATVVERLEAAGAVLLAKLSMGELAMGDVWFGGRTRNPWRPTQGSSGSSAGSGAAVAAGLVGFALGTETLGSIVSPSVRCGVTGLRPTYGRVSRHGAMALSWTMDKVGPMARGVEDCALVLAAVCGADGRDPTAADARFDWTPDEPLERPLRVGYDVDAFAAVSRTPHVRALYDAVLDRLRVLGHLPEPVRLPARNPAYDELAGLIIDVESAAAFDDLSRSGRLDELVQQGPASWPNAFRVGATVPAVDYLRALRARTRLQQEMDAALAHADVYVTVPSAGRSILYTNLTGHPTVVTRCGVLDGLPRSVEFTGQLYGESALLRLARDYERAAGVAGVWPDVNALPETPP